MLHYDLPAAPTLSYPAGYPGALQIMNIQTLGCKSGSSLVRTANDFLVIGKRLSEHGNLQKAFIE
jgi:hypothetical protein